MRLDAFTRFEYLGQGLDGRWDLRALEEMNDLLFLMGLDGLV